MKNRFAYLLVAGIVITGGLALILIVSLSKNDKPQEAIEYPKVRRDEVVDDYHGINISDPYRWLEDPYTNETKDFIEEQNELTWLYLDSEWKTFRKIRKALREIWNYSEIGIPSKQGSKYYFSNSDAQADYNELMVQDDLEGEPRLFVDFNDLSEVLVLIICGNKLGLMLNFVFFKAFFNNYTDGCSMPKHYFSK